MKARAPYPAANCCRWRRNRRPRRHGGPIQLRRVLPGLHLFPQYAWAGITNRCQRTDMGLPSVRWPHPPRTAVPGLHGIPSQTGDAGPPQAGSLKEIMAATDKGGQEKDEEGTDLAVWICPTGEVFISALRSRPEFRSGTWQTNGIASLRVSIEHPRSENACCHHPATPMRQEQPPGSSHIPEKPIAGQLFEQHSHPPHVGHRPTMR